MDYQQFIIKSDYIREVFMEARLALERGDRPVGVVIVHNEKMIVRASDTSNTNLNPLNHGVINAISKIPEYLLNNGPECVVYTTYEPCLMCLGAIVNFGIQEIYFMSGTSNPQKYEIPPSVLNYFKGPSEKWSADLFKKYHEKMEPDGMPLPPQHLIFKVIATTDREGFFKSGHILNSFEQLLAKHGKAINELRSVLDFGCGCGRITRHWKKFENMRVHGTDYNPELVKWCKYNLKFARFDVNGLQPPVRYSDQMFDFIYMISIFTHWSEPLQLQWIDEIKRILMPGGLLYFTTHGNSYVNQLDDQELTRYKTNQLVIKNDFVEGTNDCASFQSYYHVRDKLSPGFEILEFIPGGPKNQDQYLFRKL